MTNSVKEKVKSKWTPDTRHAGRGDFSSVYEPSDDSFLFLDCLESEAEFIRSLKPLVSLEVGSGSGILTAFLLARVLSSECLCLCTDANAAAAACTSATGEANGVRLLPVACDIADACLPRLEGRVDLLLCNPPYVPTPDEEFGDFGDLSAAWAGGARGRRMIDRLLCQAERLVRGAFYLLLMDANRPDEVAELMRKRGFQVSVVASRHCGGENLVVMRFLRCAQSPCDSQRLTEKFIPQCAELPTE